VRLQAEAFIEIGEERPAKLRAQPQLAVLGVSFDVLRVRMIERHRHR
jgi:hypothetical protein